ncbi:YciI family protein [Arthrobacter sp. STN4]|uniref:YciI family protein n=1 Tax=Arthrobacter sp. STN4 TaxID=2923276 RepID=UPI00211A8001|nr:YciI family protein [Arthrobacter sp. STN4]MCQ9165424.1 YciI family protein [Arthrobacter sp. STN4]
MSLFAVTYNYTVGSDAGRNEHRPLHMKFLTGLFESGRLVVSGPTDAAGPGPGALLVVRADSGEEAEEIMGQDPFALKGYVERTVKSWDPKFGADRLAGASVAAGN